MSLWRKRNVHHNEQKHDNLVNILPNLSIQSDDLSIKREKAMREVQRLGQEIEQSKEIEMKQTLELALEALERSVATCFDQRSHDEVMGRPEHFVNRAITAIKKALAQEQDGTYVYASNLAKTIWQKHYIKESPKFALLDSTEGVLTQIDNMTCGLVREKPAQPEQEPVALQYPQKDIDWQQEQQIKAQASIPPQRTWVGLTNEERLEVAKHNMLSGLDTFAQAIEAKLKEKNT